jgi:hypothetical protein
LLFGQRRNARCLKLRDLNGSQREQRMMTVEDPGLAANFSTMALHEGDRVSSPVGYGGLGPNLGILEAS